MSALARWMPRIGFACMALGVAVGPLFDLLPVELLFCPGNFFGGGNKGCFLRAVPAEDPPPYGLVLFVAGVLLVAWGLWLRRRRD